MGQPFYFSLSLPLQMSSLYPFSEPPLLSSPHSSSLILSALLTPPLPSAPSFRAFPPALPAPELGQISSSELLTEVAFTLRICMGGLQDRPGWQMK